MDAKRKAIAKHTGERFAKNPFARKYKETNEARERARHADRAIPKSHRRDSK